MSSTSEISSQFGHCTEIHDFGDLTEKDLSKELPLITVQKGKRILFIYSPSGKIISIGRSQQNNISLSDPHFPRKAAEIILGPLPVLRKNSRVGGKNHEIIPIPSGKPFKIYPYTFRLLKTGDILINRLKNTDDDLKPSKRLLILVTVIVFSVLLIYQFLIYHRIANTKLKVATDPFSGQRSKLFDPGKIVKLEMEKDNSDYQGSPDNDKKDIPVKSYVMNSSYGQRPISIKVNKNENVVSTEKDNYTLLEVGGIDLKEFEQIIETAKEFISNGNPDQAGCVIHPVLRHLNLAQRSRLIEYLEPSMKSLYQRAYMLMQYDRSAANASLNKIVRSGLDLLPSYQKAKSIIESEKKVETALGGNYSH